MKIISVDPSFTRTGVFLNGEVPSGFGHKVTAKVPGASFISFSSKIDEASFPGIHISVRRLVEELEEITKAYKPGLAIMEYPPPQSSYSPGLFTLDNMILDMFVHRVGEVFLLHSGAIDSFFKKKSTAKSVIVKETRKELGAKLTRLNHDQASAYVLYQVVRKWEQEKVGPTLYKAVYKDGITTIYKIKNKKVEKIAEHASTIFSPQSLHEGETNKV
jgi:hypothetical protein